MRHQEDVSVASCSLVQLGEGGVLRLLGAGEGKGCNERQETNSHRKGTLMLVPVGRTSAFPLLTTSAFYLL